VDGGEGRAVAGKELREEVTSNRMADEALKCQSVERWQLEGSGNCDIASLIRKDNIIQGWKSGGWQPFLTQEAVANKIP
jgi:hypothetical protein